MDGQAVAYSAVAHMLSRAKNPSSVIFILWSLLWSVYLVVVSNKLIVCF